MTLGKIILIDDEKYEQQLLELALRKKGWDVKEEYFSDPEEAFFHLQESSDMIFLIFGFGYE